MLVVIKVLSDSVGLHRSSSCFEPSFWHTLPARILSRTAHHRIISAHHLSSFVKQYACLQPSIDAGTSLLCPRQHIQLRSLFCFSKALLHIKNCEKVVVCFQHENRISFMSAVYAWSSEYLFWRLSVPNRLSDITSLVWIRHIGIVHISVGIIPFYRRTIVHKSTLKTNIIIIYHGYSAFSFYLGRHALHIISSILAVTPIISLSYSDLILIIRGTPRELVCSILILRAWYISYYHRHYASVYSTLSSIYLVSGGLITLLTNQRASARPPIFFLKAAPSQKERKADRKTCSTYTKLTQVERFIHRLASTSLYLTSQGPMDIQEYLKHSSLSTSSYPTSTFTLRRRENIFYQDFKEQWHP